jgi:hypothetical protein
MLTDQSSQLWVTSSNLLKDWLKHLRILLNDLAELLKLRVVSEEVEIAQSSTGSTCTCSCSSSSTTSTASSLCSLSSLLEKIYRLITTFSCWLLGGGNGGNGGCGGRSLSFPNVLGDTLRAVLAHVITFCKTFLTFKRYSMARSEL